MKRLIPLAIAGHAKADPFFYAVAVSAASAVASQREVLDDATLLFWLLMGSMCGFCYSLFRDEKKVLTWRGALSKLVTCFIPGFCLTGVGIKISQIQYPQFEASTSVVLGLSMLLSVMGVKIVDMLSKNLAGKIGGEL